MERRGILLALLAGCGGAPSTTEGIADLKSPPGNVDLVIPSDLTVRDQSAALDDLSMPARDLVMTPGDTAMSPVDLLMAASPDLAMAPPDMSAVSLQDMTMASPP